MPLLVPSNRCLLIRSWKVHLVTLLVLGIPSAARLPAQAVCLPAPRLLTTVPMGGQVGTEVEVTITGENLEDVTELHFSDPRITARPVADSSGARFIVAIAPQTPRGLYEARVMCRLGLSTSRVFHVSDLPETIRRQPNTSVESAMDLALNTVCNASVTPRAIDYYRFDARQGQRIVVDCAARGIESKLTPVVILADARGNDLVVERRGGLLSFAVPADGKYLVKIHDLTFQGGETHFYRLVVHDIGAEAPLPSRIPSTQTVSAFSWPPVGLAPEAARTEPTPDPGAGDVQTVTLPCDVAGSFFPAADVDTFEFTAKKGEVWWIEVASQRLGRPTDPFAVVQQVRGDGEAATVTDVAEFSDIASPIKPSSNFYSYDGPPYDGGSPDILGRLEIKEDGKYRLQLRDLFGATRNDPQNVYRLVIRQAAPDFALAAWALHMELRNGDRNDLSKPLSLRGGATMPLEVVALRRDGFDGDIELEMAGLPDGVTATGLKIPAGKSRGIMLVTARQDAPRALASVSFVGRAQIGGATVTRPCRLASVAWPVKDHWSEIPQPRLLADVPVSVNGSEQAPLTIAPAEDKVWEVVAGQKLTVPLIQTRRCEFSGAAMSVRTLGAGFDHMPAFNLPLTADAAEAVLDLAALKTAPGDYRIAFYGSAVAKYRYHPEGIQLAEVLRAKAEQDAAALAAEAKRAAEEAQAAPVERKAEMEQKAQAAADKHKSAVAAVEAAARRVKAATDQAQPKDIVDIVVSQPITIRVMPAEKP